MHHLEVNIINGNQLFWAFITRIWYPTYWDALINTDSWFASYSKPAERKKRKEQHRKYDAGFKQQVLQMIANGRCVREIAESLGIGEKLIYRWRSRQVNKVTAGKENASAPTYQQALLRRIWELETERDIAPMLMHVL